MLCIVHNIEGNAMWCSNFWMVSETMVSAEGMCVVMEMEGFVDEVRELPWIYKAYDCHGDKCGPCSHWHGAMVDRGNPD